MAFTISPNMQLPIPGVGTQPGPQYAQNVNSSLTIVDSHDHSPGNGVQITPAGLDINSDLTLNGWALFNVGRSTFTSQSLDPSAVESLYVKGVDLYYKDGNSNVIRITQLGSVAGASGTISGLTSPASAAYALGTFVFQQDVGEAANIDAGPLTIRKTSASSAGVTLQAPSSISSNYNLFLPPLPLLTNVMVLDASGNINSITYDAVGTGMTSTGANAIGASMTSTGANAVANSRSRSVASTVSAGGVATSSSCGTFPTASSSYVNITNLSVTITTTGRPVKISLLPAAQNTAVDSYLAGPASGATEVSVRVVQGTLNWVEKTTLVSGQNVPCPIGTLTDVSVNGVPGTYTYTASMKSSAGVSVSLIEYYLEAYEM